MFVVNSNEPPNPASSSDLADGTTLAKEALIALAEVWYGHSPVARSILKQRILADQPATLQEIGDEFGVTRERIRQIQNQVERSLNAPGGASTKIATIANLVRPGLAAITTESELEGQIKTVFPPTIEGFDEVTSNDQPEIGQVTDHPLVALAQQLLKKELDYTCTDGVCFNKDAVDVVQDLKQAAKSIGDDKGIVDELALQKHLPDDSWVQDWEPLVQACGLYRLSGQLSLRDTAIARTKAAVLSIGHPATKEEVAQLCGLTLKHVGLHLSTMPEIVRADKKRWGLKEWIEDPYHGIPAEIIQRIEEDGGATRLERLLEELPRMFGVGARSVETFARTPRFQINDGYVSLANPSLIALRPFEEVIHGRTDDGLPYWRFKVKSRYVTGYSLRGLPIEIAKTLGCEPDGRLRVPILFPAGCRPVSVGWPLSSRSGADLGYLSDPLRLLDTKPDESIYLVLEACGSVSLRRSVDLPEATAEKSDHIST